MNKILRLTFALAMALVCGTSLAQTTVTFTAGTDKGTQTDAGTAPDKLSKDGITIETTSGNSAFGLTGSKANYRFAKSSTTSFSSTVGNITKVVFTCTASGTAKYGPGNFDSPSAGTYTYDGTTGTWTGDAASFTLTATSNQVRATKIEVTYTPNGDTPTPTLAAPIISGETPFTETTTVTITADEGATIYYTTDGQTPDDRGGTQYTAPFTLSETATVKAIAYKDNLESTVAEKEFTKQGAVTTTGSGTIENPYTVADVIALQNANAAPSDSVYVTGKVSTPATTVSSYGDANYYISDDGTTTSEIEAYNSYYFKKAKYTDASQLPKANDVVVLYGKITKYGNTIELARGNYLVSLNGSTDPTVVVKDTASYTVAQAVEILTAKTETTDPVFITGTISEINNISTDYGNATYYISDDGTTNGQLEVFRGRFLNNAKFTAEDQIKVGDVVKIVGVLTNYTYEGSTDTVQEVTNSYIVTLNGKSATGINAVKTVTLDDNSPIYNIAGQRVGKDYKGLVIQNGRKFILK